MKMMGNMAIVEFNRASNKVLAKGIDGVDIVRAEKWISDDGVDKKERVESLLRKAEVSRESYHKSYSAASSFRESLRVEMHYAQQEAEQAAQELAQSTSRFDENTNYLETNPQIAVVKHPNAKLKYEVGDTVFLHYMAWEWAEPTDDGHVIDTDFILFQILEDGTLEMIDDLYLGEAVYSSEEITPSGIILLEGKKDNLKVKLTHLPKNNKDLKAGDIVLSVDKNNYEFDYNGKKYVKIMRDEIVGVIGEVKIAI